LVEQGDLGSPKIRALLAQYVQPLLAWNVDFIVLGCTHYPFLAPLIQEIAGPSVMVIDSGAAIARELKSRLERTELLANQAANIGGIGNVQFWSSDTTGKAKQVISHLWKNDVGETDVDVALLPEHVLA
jgi:glutamate racemase